MTRTTDAGYITVKEMSGLLNVSTKTVRALIRAQRIPATKVGRAYQLHWPSVHARLMSGEGFTVGWWRE